MSLSYFEYRRPRHVYISRKISLAIIVLVIVTIIVGVVASNIVVADVGEAIAIVDPFAKEIVSVVFGPAWTVKAPWQYTKEVYVAVQVANFLVKEGTAIEALSKDGAKITVEVTIRFEVKRDPEAVKYLVTKYAREPTKEIVEGVITPITKEVVRDVISQYKLTEIIEKRAELPILIADRIRERLEKDETVRIALRIIDVAVRGIYPPAKVLEAIEAKLKAQQEAEAAKYMYIKQVTLANATRMSRIIEAEGLKEATIIQAIGQREAIKQILMAFNNRTDLLLWYFFVQALRDFNGTLIIILTPTPNITTPLLITLPSR